MRIVNFVLMTAFAVAQPACAEKHDPTAFNLDRLTGQPGVAVSQKQEGSASVTVWAKNGVSVTRAGDGGKTTVWENDNTGKGAVVCNWMVDVEVRADLEFCHNDPRLADLRRDLSQSIRLIDEFIVANSYQPVTLEEMHAREEIKYAKARQKAQNDPAASERLCTEGDTGKFISYFSEMPHADRHKLVSDLLSVPRWPALNPCL